MKISMALMLFYIIGLTACSMQPVATSETEEMSNKLVDIKWDKPENYHDVRSPNLGQAAYQENVFHHLNKHFQKMAAKHLPKGFYLKVVVTDLNLAGDTRFSVGRFQDMRVVKRQFWPSMKFEYHLYEGDNLIKTEKMTVKDMAFLDRVNISRYSDTLYYEKRLITDWFHDELTKTVILWQKRQTAVMS